jgi:hypothetical protein
MAFTAAVILLAAANAIIIPLQLEDQILRHPKVNPVLLAGQLTYDWSSAAQLREVVHVIQGNSSSRVGVGAGGVPQPLLSRARKLARRRLPSAEAAVGEDSSAGSRQEQGDRGAATAAAPRSPSAAAAAAAPVSTGAPAPTLADVLRPAAAQQPVQAAAAAQALLQWLEAYLGPSGPQGCPAASPFKKAVGKHYYEVSRVQVSIATTYIQHYCAFFAAAVPTCISAMVQLL